MTALNPLRFDDLPTFESTPTFFSLPDEVDRRLRVLPNVHARTTTALRFVSLVGADASIMHVRDTEVDSMHAAYLRAALMDYVGMEESLPGDLRRCGIRQSPLRITDTANAMLIVVQELRHLQIHCVTPLEQAERTAYLPAHPEHTVVLSAQMLPYAELLKLKDARNAKRYDRDEFQRALQWLASAQSHWGIADVVLQCIWAYAARIVDHHLQLPGTTG